MADTNPFLQKFLNRNSLHLVMFGHVEALRLNGLKFSVDHAIVNFMTKHGISEDDLPIEGVRTAYYRMRNDYTQSQKSDGNT